MKYLLDTCALSEAMKPMPNKAFMLWLDEQHETHLFLSWFSIGELYKGIYKLAEKKRQNLLKEWLEKDLLLRFSGRILSIDHQIIESWGKMSGSNEQKGIKLPVMDSLIAATANAHNLTVITRNIKDMERCSVKLYNPWDT